MAKKFKTKITEMLGIDYPIISGGMQWLSRAELVAAAGPQPFEYRFYVVVDDEINESENPYFLEPVDQFEEPRSRGHCLHLDASQTISTTAAYKFGATMSGCRCQWSLWCS